MLVPRFTGTCVPRCVYALNTFAVQPICHLYIANRNRGHKHTHTTHNQTRKLQSMHTQTHTRKWANKTHARARRVVWTRCCCWPSICRPNGPNRPTRIVVTAWRRRYSVPALARSLAFVSRTALASKLIHKLSRHTHSRAYTNAHTHANQPKGVPTTRANVM